MPTITSRVMCDVLEKQIFYRLLAPMRTIAEKKKTVIIVIKIITETTYFALCEGHSCMGGKMTR